MLSAVFNTLANTNLMFDLTILILSTLVVLLKGGYYFILQLLKRELDARYDLRAEDIKPNVIAVTCTKRDEGVQKKQPSIIDSSDANTCQGQDIYGIGYGF